MAKSRDIRVAGDGTVSDVREALSLEAERVMAESKPTPTQAEIDAIVSGEAHLDEKVSPDNPEMPPLGVQEEMLNSAEPDPPPVIDNTLPPEPPPVIDNTLPPEPPPPDPVAAAAEAQRRQAAAADPKAPYNTRTVPRQ